MILLEFYPSEGARSETVEWALNAAPATIQNVRVDRHLCVQRRSSNHSAARVGVRYLRQLARNVTSTGRKGRCCFRKSRNSVGLATEANSDQQFRCLGGPSPKQFGGDPGALMTTTEQLGGSTVACELAASTLPQLDTLFWAKKGGSLPRGGATGDGGNPPPLAHLTSDCGVKKLSHFLGNRSRSYVQ